MADKIKILHYLTNLGLGGTEKTCQLFMEYASSEFEVHLAYLRDGDMVRKHQFLLSANVVGGKLHALENKGELQKLIDYIKPDILHVYRSGYEEHPIPGKDVHVPHFVETNVFGFLDGNPLIDKSLFMSQWLMNYALQRYPQLKNHPRFDFVNNPVEEPTTGFKYKFDAPEDAVILGRCGRPDNGIYNDVSVRAASLLRLQGYNVRFLVVAPPSNMIDDLGKYEVPFHIIQPTVDPIALSQFYNTIDIYAHARADGETFGVNIAEAMMHGNPVVTHIATPSFSGMGVFQSQTELVDDGDTGFIVQNDVALYAEALKKLIEDKELRKSMGDAGRRKAHEQYHAKACVDKLERIYREVING